jgi:hypothetical protein
MKIEVFAKMARLSELTELERIASLAFYLSENKGQPEFAATDLSAIMVGLGFAKPNTSRLKTNIQKSRNFVRGITKDTFRLSLATREALSKQYPDLSESEEVVSDDSLLPEVLFDEARRPYLKKIAQQINSSYENNLFDACALMMRRLLEILLIHAFQNLTTEDEIKDQDGDYVNLKTLVNKAKSSKQISLSNSVRKSIDDFRELGNLSAHRVTYNCRRDDIRKIRLEYRALIEELLYKSGFLKP